MREVRPLLPWFVAACLPSLLFSASIVRAEEQPSGAAAVRDWRDLESGSNIPSEGYCDQPYVVVLPDGRWLCVMTTGKGKEGDRGQHIVSTASADHGRTWTPLQDIEPADGPEASWAVPLVTPAGRVYVFYDYNGERIAALGSRKIRADMLGWYVYKFSDDGGASWSEQRYRLPLPLTAVDRSNDWQGKVQMFWGICKPQPAAGAVAFSFTKVGKYLIDQGEGRLYRSDNILTERDATKIRWSLLPENERRIHAPQEGSVQEEHNLVWLGGTDWYCVYRTTQGYPCHTYSRDDGKTWDPPTPMTYSPDGPIMRNPRANAKLFRTSTGKFLFWFHNHGGKSYEDRNPAWLSGGELRDGKLHWSQPEIVLYVKDQPKTRMSYPDLIEEGGRYWLTETTKDRAGVHEIPASFLEALWRQPQYAGVSRDELRIEVHAQVQAQALRERTLPLSGPLDVGRGLSLDFWIRFDEFKAGQVIFDARNAAGEGLLVETGVDTIRARFTDGTGTVAWESDADKFAPGRSRHVVLSIDPGPRIATFVIDGKLSDGAGRGQFGWQRYAHEMRNVAGIERVAIGPKLAGEVLAIRCYERTLGTSEAVSHFHAGLPASR